MKKNKYKFVIVSPKFVMGGPVVLHTLCRNLNTLGFDAKILYLNSFIYPKKGKSKYWINWSFYKIKSYVKKILVKIMNADHFEITMDMKMKCREKIFPFVGKNTIVVYPEIIFGNPLKAKKTVRWLLYHNKLYGQDENGNSIGYEKNDLFFAYREVFNDERLNPACRLLHISYYDLELYKRTNYGERTGNCYILRKGALRPDVPKEFDGLIIDNMSEEKIVETFNRCKYCISYDTQTAYSKIAALCGCISIVVPEEGKTWRDYRSEEEHKSDFGVAFGFDDEEIKRAKNTMGRAKEYFERVNQGALSSVKSFVVDCENYF